MTIYEVLALLRNVEGPDGSGNYKACCPAHDDKKQSLSVKQGSKGVVFKCFAGCGTRQICEALHIEMKDLFAEAPKAKPQASQRRIVKTYPYTDRDGKLVFEVVRYEPKSFSQRMPDPEHPGRWIWKSSPVQPLYRLPEVVKAIEEGRSVCLAEGEKDAETLAALGYCGTTIAMGAGKWKSQHTEQLQGAHVILFPDNDLPGREYMKQVALEIGGVAKSVKLLDLKDVWPEIPNKGDVSDMAAALGADKAKELIELAINNPKLTTLRANNAQAKTPGEQARLYDDSEAGRLFSKVTGYTVKDGCICQFTSDGGVKQLSTFAVIPRRVVTRDDGQTTQTGFEIEGWDRDGRGLGTEWVTSKEFASMSWPVEHWGFRANIMPGNTNKDKLRYVIAEVGSMAATRHTLYTHTGWRQLGGRTVFLHAGGAIGGEDVSVQLEGRLGTYDMSIGDRLPAQDGALAALEILNVMDPSAAFPLLALSYLAPLCEFEGRKGIMPRFALYLLGQTQTRKTTAALLALSHFGNFNSQDKIPASFNDTAYSVQRSAFLLKDMPILVDDYFPVGNIQARRRMEEMAQTLSRSFGNGASRGRLNSDMTQRETFTPRGVAVFTGEDLPDIKESGLARYFIIRFGKETVKADDKLTRLQEAASEGALAASMRGYIEFLAAQADELPAALYRRYMNFRSQAVKNNRGGARSSEAIAQLLLGLDMAFRYFVSLDVMTEDQRQAYMEAAWISLCDSSEAQAKDISSQKPSVQFINIVRELLQSGVFKCLNEDGNDSGINVLGYKDGVNYYFFPETLYKAVSKFCSDQGTVFPVGPTQLKKQLVEDGILPEGCVSRVKRIRGKTARYMVIARPVIDGEDPDAKPPESRPRQEMMETEDPDNPF
ncbi:MAG: DUF927 domain-containing protein [Clostridiales bacterium]|nr:DUF927 domain-containing protein [Clostridiales bacterium]